MTVLRVQELQDGTVKDSTVVQSSGNAELDQAAISCMSAARLRPITHESEPIEAAWERAVLWRVRGPSSIIVPQLPGKPLRCSSRRLFSVRGTVSISVSFEIDTDGIPQKIKVIRSSGNGDLDGVVSQCLVPGFRYFGATHAGEPIEIDWETTVDWKGR